MNDRTKFILVCLSVCFMFAGVSSAQDRKSVQTLMKSWDKNKNGLLEKSEIPASARGKFAVLAKRKELDLEKGVPINQLLEGNAEKSLRFGRKTRKGSENDGVAGGDGAEDKELKPKPDLPSKQDPKAPAKGFGDSRSVKRTKGFGSSKPLAASSSEMKTGAEKEGQPGKTKESPEQKGLRVLAKAMLAQHDSNKSGRLEKREWSQLRGNPAASDRNRDGVLTVEELEGHLRGFAVSEKPPRASHSPKPSKRPMKTSSGKSYRFLTPHERLPKGLPDWFTDKDANRDGQVSLHEYVSALSQAEVDAFRAFDLNNDGLIVAREYLKATN